MGKESIVEINGHQYRYEYVDGQTVYKGPVGDAPELAEAEFLKLLELEHGDEIITLDINIEGTRPQPNYELVSQRLDALPEKGGINIGHPIDPDGKEDVDNAARWHLHARLVNLAELQLGYKDDISVDVKVTNAPSWNDYDMDGPDRGVRTFYGEFIVKYQDERVMSGDFNVETLGEFVDESSPLDGEEMTTLQYEITRHYSRQQP